jgi:hypothetical protein
VNGAGFGLGSCFGMAGPPNKLPATATFWCARLRTVHWSSDEEEQSMPVIMEKYDSREATVGAENQQSICSTS